MEWTFICGERPTTNRLSHDMATSKKKDTEEHEQNKIRERGRKKIQEIGKSLIKVPYRFL
jgi:hypothetical protein